VNYPQLTPNMVNLTHPHSQDPNFYTFDAADQSICYGDLLSSPHIFAVPQSLLAEPQATNEY
jgi:hypothetical protein